MKKEVTILIITLALLIPITTASDVAYITKNSKSIDQGFINAFNNQGLTSEIILSKNIPQTNFSKYKLIFISDTRLKNTKQIPVNTHPTIIANRYYGKTFEISYKGISKLASNAPLKIIKNNVLAKVYDRPFFIFRRLNIPYYYIPAKYSLSDMQSIATTSIGYKKELGDVIAYSKTKNKCFFGITKTKYWTQHTKDLFNNCIAFTLNNPYPTPTPPITTPTPPNTGYGVENHDVALIDFTNSIRGIRLEYTNGTDILEGHAQLICNQKYKIGIKIKNQGDYYENITFNGVVNSLLFNHLPKNNLASGKTSLKTKTVNFTLPSGIYNITIEAVIPIDNFSENNLKSRQIEVVC